MATYKTADAVGAREDLSNVIYRIDPSDTPLLSNMQKETTKGITTEWQVQELAAAVDTNHQNEGADYSYKPNTDCSYVQYAPDRNESSFCLKYT